MAHPVLLITSYLTLVAAAAGGWGLYTIEQEANQEGRQAVTDRERLVKENQLLKDEVAAYRQGEKELEISMDGAARSLKEVQTELDTIKQWAEERESAYAQAELNGAAKPEELEALTVLITEPPSDGSTLSVPPPKESNQRLKAFLAAVRKERESALAEVELLRAEIDRRAAKPEESEAPTVLTAESPSDKPTLAVSPPNEAKQRLMALENRLTAVQKERESALAEVELLRAEMDRRADDSAQLSALLEKLKERSEATESGIHKLAASQEKLSDTSSSVAPSAAINPELLKNLETLRLNVEARGREVRHLQSVIAGMRSEAGGTHWREDLKAIEQELSAYQQRTEAANSELERLRELFALQREIETSKADEGSDNTSSPASEAVGVTSTSDRSELSTPLDSALETLKGRVGEDNATIERLTLLLESLRDQSAKTTIKATALESLVVELKDDQASLKQLVAQLKVEKQTAQERLNQLEQEFKELTSTSNLEVHKLADQLTLIRVGGDLLFDTGDTTIRPEARVGLDLVAAVIGGFPDRPLSIEGHTDNVPIAKSHRRFFPSNWELSAARAASAARYLIAKGVDPSRITVVGWGEEHPIGSNSAKEGRSRNRRIEILLLPARKRQIRALDSG